MEKTIKIDGKEYKLTPIEEEFMPRPKEGEEFYYIDHTLDVVWMQEYHGDDTYYEYSFYNYLNIYTNKDHAEAMAALKRNIAVMVRKYGLDNNVYFLDVEDKWSSTYYDNGHVLDQLFSPLLMPKLSTEEEGKERLELIKNVRKFLPNNN